MSRSFLSLIFIALCLLLSLSVPSRLAAAGPDDGCGDGIAHGDFPEDFDPFDDEPGDPFLSRVAEYRIELGKVQRTLSEWSWGIRDNWDGARGKFRFLITIRQTLRILDELAPESKEFLDTARADRSKPEVDAIHDANDFLGICRETLHAVGRLFGDELKLVAPGGVPDPNERARLEAIRSETLGERAIETLSADMRRALAAANESLLILNNVLDGRVGDYDRKPVDLSLFVERLRGIYPSATVADAPDVALDTDEDMLVRAIGKLVSNARRAGGEPNEITIGFEGRFVTFQTNVPVRPNYRRVVAPGQRDGHYLGISVADRAGGMPPEVVSRLFVRGATGFAAVGGRGIGLDSIRTDILANGGFVEVETRVGEGSKFTLWLPSREAVAAPSETVASSGVAEGEPLILAIDDRTDNLTMTVLLLRSMGYEAKGYASRREALEHLAAEPGRVRVILTDLSTGDLDVTMEEFLVTTRQLSIRVVITSGYRLDTVPEGVEMAVQKPVDYTALNSAIERWMRQ